MPNSSARSGSRTGKPLVRADTELRALAATWGAAGVITLAAALALGVDRFTTLEVDGTVIVLGLSVVCALAGVFLGRRTGPVHAYMQLFEYAPAPPPTLRGESNAQTVRRALRVAIATAAGFLPVAFFLLAMALLVFGAPRSQLLDHLPAAAALIAAGWMLVCAAAARVVAAWFERWEQARGKVILCHPLRSGIVAHVYYVVMNPQPDRPG
jgi:hypothetical protein